jgi:hypothetical protein
MGVIVGRRVGRKVNGKERREALIHSALGVGPEEPSATILV